MIVRLEILDMRVPALLYLRKNETPSQALLRPRRRPNVCCAVDCARGGPGAMTSPAGIPNFLVEGSSIAQSAVGVKGLGQTPLLIADRSSNP